MKKIVVIGAGLAGLYAAYSAASHGADVELIERSTIGTKHNCGELFTEIYTTAPEECKINKIKKFIMKIDGEIIDYDFGELSPFVMTDKIKHELIIKDKCLSLGVIIKEKMKATTSDLVDKIVIDASGVANYKGNLGKAVDYGVKNEYCADLPLDSALFVIRQDMMGYSWYFPKVDCINTGDGVYDYRYKCELQKPDKKFILFSGGGVLPMPTMEEYCNNVIYGNNLISGLKVGNALGLVNPCVLPDTEIITSEGVKEIQDIIVGDKVFTHNGRFRKVTKTFVRDYIGEVIGIRPSVSSKPIIMTPEHPIYSSSNCICGWKGSENRFCWFDCQMQDQGNGGQSGRCLYKGCKHKFYENYLDNIQWTNCGTLDINQSLCYPIMKEEDDIDIETLITIGNLKMFVSYELMKFIGYYIAEGHGAKDGSRIFLDFGLTSNEAECRYVEEVVDLADSLFNKKAYVDVDDIERQRISINDINITKFLSNNFGRVSKEKIIPEWVLYLNKDLLTHLVRSMWNGDGCVKEPYQYTYYTASKNLAYTLKIVLNKLGIVCKVKIDNRSGRLAHFRGGDYYTNGGYSIIVSNSFIGKMNHILGYNEDFNIKQLQIKSKVGIKARLLDDIIISQINSISHSDYNGKVYNLEVEEDNSYCTESMALHNCLGGGEHLAVISGILAGELAAKDMKKYYYTALDEIIGTEMRFGISIYEFMKKLDIESMKSFLWQVRGNENIKPEILNKTIRKAMKKWITLPDVKENEIESFIGE